MLKALTHSNLAAQPWDRRIPIALAVCTFLLASWDAELSARPCAFQTHIQALIPPHTDLVLLEENLPPLPRSIDEIIEEAIQTWNDVPCSAATLRYRGRRPNLESLQPDEVPIAFVSEQDSICVRDLLAFTAFVCEGWPARSVLVNLDRVQWTDAPDPRQSRTELTSADLPAVLTHEFGHVLGLPHLADPLASMYERYRIDGGQSELSAVDKLALCALFPRPDHPECTSHRDCPGECVKTAEFAVCDRERRDLGHHCTIEDAVCPGLCLISSAPTETGYCSMDCAATNDCPPDMICSLGQCTFTAIQSEAQCSHNPGTPAFPLIFIAFMGLIRRRRATKAVGTLDSARRVQPREKSR